MSRFLHSGNIGDIIAFLPSLRALGGGDLVITDFDRQAGFWMQGFKYDCLKPLLDTIPYVNSHTYEMHPTDIDHDVSVFRKYWGQCGIIEMQSRTLGIEMPSVYRWIDVEEDKRTNGKIVCCRSHKYRNDRFPWHKIVEKYREDIIFVGLYDERGDFIDRFGHVASLWVDNLLDLAKLIEGSAIFIGNQSSPFWIAASLNHPAIQETSPDIPDSIVPYKDTHYSIDGDFAPIDFLIKKALDKNIRIS
jgi:hypothetical protein